MAQLTERQRYDFIAGYCEAALWASTCVAEDGLSITLDECEWGPGEKDKRAAECGDFIAYAGDLLVQYAEKHEPHPLRTVWALAGHDFWLTRCGHGVGFWDRGLGKLGDDLTTACKTFGNIDLYLGDSQEVFSC